MYATSVMSLYGNLSFLKFSNLACLEVLYANLSFLNFLNLAGLEFLDLPAGGGRSCPSMRRTAA